MGREKLTDEALGNVLGGTGEKIAVEPYFCPLCNGYVSVVDAIYDSGSNCVRCNKHPGQIIEKVSKTDMETPVLF